MYLSEFALHSQRRIRYSYVQVGTLRICSGALAEVPGTCAFPQLACSPLAPRDRRGGASCKRTQPTSRGAAWAASHGEIPAGHGGSRVPVPRNVGIVREPVLGRRKDYVPGQTSERIVHPCSIRFLPPSIWFPSRPSKRFSASRKLP